MEKLVYTITQPNIYFMVIPFMVLILILIGVGIFVYKSKIPIWGTQITKKMLYGWIFLVTVMFSFTIFDKFQTYTYIKNALQSPEKWYFEEGDMIEFSKHYSGLQYRPFYLNEVYFKTPMYEGFNPSKQKEFKNIKSDIIKILTQDQSIKIGYINKDDPTIMKIWIKN